MARRASTSTSRRASTPPTDAGAYLTVSRTPWHIFWLLLPLVLLYEVGSWLLLMSPDGTAFRSVQAEWLLERAFERFGVTGLHLPAIVILVVLLLWHLLARDSWRIRWTVLLGMFVESILWTFPLLVLAILLDPTALAQAGGDVRDWTVAERLTISIGAGLYEELLFRMVIIAAVHFALVDLFRVPNRAGTIAAVTISALLFAWYHLPGGVFHAGWFAFYAAAGAYFGLVYVLRGFGIVVMAHAIYDLIVLVLLNPAT